MNCWRMQLHPNHSTFSSFYAYQSIAKGFIGLGFVNKNVGDLLKISNTEELGKQSVYLCFATQMQPNDLVLIISHNNPLAVVKVKSGYNYIRHTLPKLRVWFNHFRTIDRDGIIYLSDVITKIKLHAPIPMTNTISSLSEKTQSYKLIRKMVQWDKRHNPETIYQNYFNHS